MIDYESLNHSVWDCKYHATPANRSDTEEFVTVLDEVGAKTGESIYADKGYSSQLNQHVLGVRGLSGGIIHKAARNRELTLAERAANRLISSVRAKAERVFGTLKRGYGFFRTRYLGLARSNGIFPQCYGFQLEKSGPQGRLLRKPASVGWQMPSAGWKHPEPGEKSATPAASRP